MDNKDIDDPLKHGWIETFNDKVIKCILRKEYELDDELTINRDLLTPDQDKLVETGLIIRYNKKSNNIQFLLDSGDSWI